MCVRNTELEQSTINREKKREANWGGVKNSCGDLTCGLFDTIRRTNELAESSDEYVARKIHSANHFKRITKLFINVPIDMCLEGWIVYA